MKKIITILILLFLLFDVNNIKSNAGTAKADEFINPNEICAVEIISGNRHIVCGYDNIGKKLVFTKLNQPFKMYYDDQNGEYEIWTLQQSSSMFRSEIFSLIVKNRGSFNSYNDLLVTYVGRVLTINNRFSTDDARTVARVEKDTIELRPKDASGNWDPRLAKFYKVNAEGWSSITIKTPNTWESSLPSEFSNQLECLKRLADNLDTNGIGIKVMDHSTVEAEENEIEACKEYVVGLVSENPTAKTEIINQMKTGFADSIARYKESEDANDENIARLERLLNNAFRDDNPVSSSKDKELFERYYYKSNPSNYKPDHPNIPVTKELITDFGSMVTEGSTIAAIAGYDSPNKWYSQVWDYFIIVSTTKNVIDSIEKEMQSAYAYYYIKKNLEFRKCVGEKFPNSEYAGYDPELDEWVENLYSTTYSDHEGYAKNEKEGVCDKIEGGIMGMIGQAFCAIAVMFKAWANWLFQLAVSWLNASLGILDNSSVTTPPSGL